VDSGSGAVVIRMKTTDDDGYAECGYRRVRNDMRLRLLFAAFIYYVRLGHTYDEMEYDMMLSPSSPLHRLCLMTARHC